jgi:hypothetical protein
MGIEIIEAAGCCAGLAGAGRGGRTTEHGHGDGFITGAGKSDGSHSSSNENGSTQPSSLP